MNMQSNTVLYDLQFSESRTWLVAALMSVGNILLPQLCHLVPQGGLILLPIYFFTLIGAYKYGLRAGLLIAVASPLANHLLFGMPPAPMLPVLLFKGTALAVVAARSSWRATSSSAASARPSSQAASARRFRTSAWAGPDCCCRWCWAMW